VNITGAPARLLIQGNVNLQSTYLLTLRIVVLNSSLGTETLITQDVSYQGQQLNAMPIFVQAVTSSALPVGTYTIKVYADKAAGAGSGSINSRLVTVAQYQ
jgi:hypothetical protein